MAVTAGIAVHQIEAPACAKVRVTAHSILTINSVLTVSLGEFLSGIEPLKYNPPRKLNGV